MIASFIGIRPQPERVLLVMQPRHPARDAQAPVDVRAARQAQAQRCQRRIRAARPGRHGADGQRRRCRRTARAAAARSAMPAWSRSIPSDGVPRALWIAPAGSAAPEGPALDPALWQWSEVRSGIVTVSAPIVDAFVPQMLNYESVGGVNFKKGCYPGQEVVARSQFRGTLKRRAYLVQAPSAAGGRPGGLCRQRPRAAGRHGRAGGADARRRLGRARVDADRGARCRRPARRQRRGARAQRRAPALSACSKTSEAAAVSSSAPCRCRSAPPAARGRRPRSSSAPGPGCVRAMWLQVGVVVRQAHHQAQRLRQRAGQIAPGLGQGGARRSHQAA